LDDLRRCLEIAKRVLAHPKQLNRFKSVGQGGLR
jgi:hypothetical protein